MEVIATSPTIMSTQTIAQRPPTALQTQMAPKWQHEARMKVLELNDMEFGWVSHNQPTSLPLYVIEKLFGA